MPTLSLSIQFASDAPHLPNRNQIRRWVNAALRVDTVATVRIVDEVEGRALISAPHHTWHLAFTWLRPSKR